MFLHNEYLIDHPHLRSEWVILNPIPVPLHVSLGMQSEIALVNKN